MAEEEVVIVEGDNQQAKPETKELSDSVSKAVGDQAQPSEAKPSKFHFKFDTKSIVFLISALLLLGLGIFLAIDTLSKKSQDENLTFKEIIFGSKKEHIPTQAKLGLGKDASDIERMIKKAKALYDSGDKENALKLYNEISMFNESISSYNLGVAKMNEGDFEGAMSYFRTSLRNGDNEFPASINAVVCAVKLRDKQQKAYFLKIAERSLPKYVSSPLYSYYYTLFQYYQGNYFEALASSSAKTGDYFTKELNEVAPRIYLLHDDNENTLEYLTRIKNRDY